MNTPESTITAARTTDHPTDRDTDTGPRTSTSTVEDAPAAPLLHVRDLSVSYGGTEVVHQVSFAVGAGKALALIGESGSGKSTIARAVLRLLGSRRAHADGSIRVQGREVTSLRDGEFLPLRGRVLGFVPQDPGSSLNPVRTIGTQALEAAALVPGARRREEREALVLGAFERVGLPEPRRLLDVFPHQLSGGQLQRVLIALAIIPGPTLLVADEPTSALDVTVQKQILDLLDSLRRELGIGILLITHDLAIAAQRADEVVVLQHGRIQEAGPTGSVFARPAAEYTRSLQADVPGLNPDRFAGLRAERDERHRLEAAVEQVALRGVSRTFRTRSREVRALDDVSLSILRGRTHALVGESGSGKSTAARALLGLERVDGGALQVGEREVRAGDRRALRDLRRHLQIVHQNPFTSLDPRFTVGRLVREPLDLYRVGSRAEREERTRWALDAVRLPTELLGRRPAELSGGQRQRVAIARALVLHPDVLVLDEPTSALDVTVQAGILEVLATLQRDLGLTYLFISHDLGVVRQFADTLTVLRAGQVVESGTVREVFAQPREEYTRRLIDSVPARSVPASSVPARAGERRISWQQTDWDDPRAVALRTAMDHEIAPRYAALRGDAPRPAPPSGDDVALVLLALVDDEVAATGTLRRLPDRWEVKRLFIGAEHRRLGLASAVLARLEDAARERGATELFLQTGNRQPEAIALYERRGWERIEVFAPYAPADGISVCFRRRLTAR